MRNVIYLAVLLAASSAAAQSVEEARTCQVTIARAPDDVREVVEAWVRSEPQCSKALEVRIVPTEGGLYLLAQDEQGRIRDRVVPDAETAGVLVASWIADDHAPAPVRSVNPFEARAPVPAPSFEAESITPPGMAPLAIDKPAEPARPSHSKWLSVGMLFPMSAESAFGLRGELDLWRRRGWTIGLAASYAESSMDVYSITGWGSMNVSDLKSVAYLARSWRFGRWQLRPSLGLGFVYAEGRAYVSDPSGVFNIEGMFVSAEGTAVLSREIGKSWAAYGGPVASLVSQRFEETYAPSTYPMIVQRNLVDVALFAGVRHRL